MRRDRRDIRRPGKRTAALAFLLILAVLAAGCSSERQTEQLEAGQYYTYYVNQSGTALVRRVYEPEAQDTEGIITELLGQCQTVPEGSDGQRAIPANVVLSSAPRLEGNVVNIYFDTTYTLMEKVTEPLCRAALAKTLTQVEGVDYISIYVNEKPYGGSSASSGEGENSPGPGGSQTETSDSSPILISGSDFLDNTGDDTNQYLRADLVLYFANAEGNALVTETQSVVYSNNLSLERVVLNQLLEGPSLEGSMATIPSTVRVQGVTVRDGVCYVDFDSTFLEDTANVTDAIVIYSIVNSLTELSTISQVQITVNGSADVSFRNNISLSGRFERDLSYLQQEEEETQTEEAQTPQETLTETEPEGGSQETEPTAAAETAAGEGEQQTGQSSVGS